MMYYRNLCNYSLKQIINKYINNKMQNILTRKWIDKMNS